LGPASSGKSTILHQFQRQTDELVPLPVVASHKSAVSVLSSLLTSVGLGPWTLSEVEQRNLLTVFARQRKLQGKRVVLCVDDLSRLAPDAWSEIDRLRLLTLVKEHTIELVVVGRDEDATRSPLFDLLHDGAMSAVEAVHYVSAPSDEDVRAYVEWRFMQSSLPSPFTADACSALNSLTQGRWSLINILCQVALVAQQRESVDVVDALLVQQAAASLAALKPNSPSTGDTVRTRQLVDEAPPPSDRLVVSCSGEIVKTIALQSRLLIGRDADNDLQLPGRFMSRHHAAVMPTAEGHFYIIDFASANGVRVNRRRVNRCLLRDGDVIEVGQFRIKVEIPARPVTDLPFMLPDTSGETDLIPVPSGELPVVRAVKH
jgi:type II secretory pathway predicted ATPase ExeA